jgi:hypothetical protein
MVAMSRVMNAAPAPLFTVRNDVPQPISAFLDLALAKSPNWPFQSAPEMRQALALSNGMPPTVQMPPVPPNQGGWQGTPPPGQQLPSYGQPPYAASTPPPPMPPGMRPPFVPPVPKPRRSPMPIILGVGAAALLLVGGFIGLLSS